MATPQATLAMIVVGALLFLGGAVGALLAWRQIARLRQQPVAGPLVPDKRKNRSGSVLGPYRLTRRLGEGGTSDVYLGEPLNGSGAQVAVKVIDLRQLQGREVAEARFWREVAILRDLHHPGIVDLVDSGQDGTLLYLVEEFVAGGHLGQKTSPGGMDFHHVWGYLRPVLAAVHYAHQQGVVHRDMKPENVLLTSLDIPKVTDFGLARINDGQKLTAQHFMGTPLYMAPEQIGGHPATALSDQYALGLMAYEMLSGKLPFTGFSIADMMSRRNAPPPPLAEAVPAPLPEGVEAIVMRMLAVAADDRFPDLAAVTQALDVVVERV